MKLIIQVPTPDGLESVHVEHHNEASYDLTALPLRAVLVHEVDEEAMTTREVLSVDAGGTTDSVLRVELPRFDTALVRHFLSGLGIHGAGSSWVEERLDERGSVVYHATDYTLRLRAFGDEVGLLAAAGWPLGMGIGGSMLLPMRLLALQAYGEGLRAEMRNAFRAPEVREEGRYGQDIRPTDVPVSGTVFDPGPRDYSGDRGSAPVPEVVINAPGTDITQSLAAMQGQDRAFRADASSWAAGVAAEFAKLRGLEDRRDVIVRVAADLGDSGEVCGFLDAPDADVVVADSTFLMPGDLDEADSGMSHPTEHRDL